ncbi:MAG: hypothetical protein N3A59_01870 [Thermodesulfovibrionales bacterium]|nr:hypothetical protein [Thermodesulfovibrionales bacterium]
MIKIPEYVSKEEVKRICKELNIRDWSELTEPSITKEEAELILSIVNLDNLPISVEEFKVGLEVELEHGTIFKNYNVTNNHPILTGMIVMAHFMEMLDYYYRLEIAELEGDFLKALTKNEFQKAKKYYSKLIEAKMNLINLEKKKLKEI